MGASITRSFLIAVLTTNILFGTVPAAADESPSGSTVGVLDTSNATLPGTTLWSQRYARPRTDTVTALGVSPDGSQVFVTGYSEGSTGYYDYATVAYDASTGATLWSKRYTRPGYDTANALRVSPDGSQVFVTGSSEGSTSDHDYATLAYDASTGATLWSKRYAHPGYDIANALRVSPDGSQVFVTGYSEGSTSYYDYATVAYDATTGATLWVKRYTGWRGGSDIARALGVSPDGSRVLVTGASYGSTSYDYATVAYDATTGATLWVKRYTRPGGDYATALGMSPDGSQVFVTGSSEGSTSSDDYASVAYDASTGATLWVKRYARPGSDYATALGMSPDGSQVFVTGESYGSTSYEDYATVAYSTV